MAALNKVFYLHSLLSYRKGANNAMLLFPIHDSLRYERILYSGIASRHASNVKK